MKTKLYYSLVLLALFFVIACKKQSVPKPTGTQGTTGTTGATGKTDTTGNIDTLGVSSTAGFYVVGEIEQVATLMKKGNMPVSLSTKATRATGIAILGKDVYVTGGLFLSEIQNIVPCYWKNGNISIFTSSYSGVATGIATQGKDVYITANITIGGTQRAFIYKNDIATELGSATGYTAATGIVVKGSDVYISGSYYDFMDNAYHACYWKNGVLTSMQQQNSSATGIKISDNSDVCLAGSIGNQPAYWKNGIATTLNVKSDYFEVTANAIAVNGNDVYVAGTARISIDSTTAVYWKNGTVNYIPAAKSLATITVVGNDVYVAGQKQSTGTDQTYAGCWKNGTLFTGESLPSVYESILWVQ